MIIELEPVSVEPRSYTNRAGAKVEGYSLLMRDLKGRGHYCGQLFELAVEGEQLGLAKESLSEPSVRVSVSVYRMFSERSIRLQGEILL